MVSNFVPNFNFAISEFLTVFKSGTYCSCSDVPYFSDDIGKCVSYKGEIYLQLLLGRH